MKNYLLLLLSLLILSSACKNDALIRPGDPLNVSYDKAWSLYEAKKYGDAAEAFEIITRIGRGTNYAQDAQFYLAESYFKDERYLLAASEYERFISFFPRDERREEVDFKRALSFYEQSPRYRLDQGATAQAIELFQLFNNNYPNSDRVPEAAEKIDALRNKLARKIFNAAEFYSRINSYKAAVIYFDRTIDQYPESVWAERALVQLIDTYNRYAERSVDEKQGERYNLALETYEKFLQLFPTSELRGAAEKYRDEAEIGFKNAPKVSSEELTAVDATN
ncbi:MAG: outer membrane protein assembly factor BamD [Balneolaceae bacterium]